LECAVFPAKRVMRGRAAGLGQEAALAHRRGTAAQVPGPDQPDRLLHAPAGRHRVHAPRARLLLQESVRPRSPLRRHVRRAAPTRLPAVLPAGCLLKGCALPACPCGGVSAGLPVLCHVSVEANAGWHGASCGPRQDYDMLWSQAHRFRGRRHLWRAEQPPQRHRLLPRRQPALGRRRVAGRHRRLGLRGARRRAAHPGLCAVVRTRAAAWGHLSVLCPLQLCLGAGAVATRPWCDAAAVCMRRRRPRIRARLVRTVLLMQIRQPACKRRRVSRAAGTRSSRRRWRAWTASARATRRCRSSTSGRRPSPARAPSAAPSSARRALVRAPRRVRRACLVSAAARPACARRREPVTHARPRRAQLGLLGQRGARVAKPSAHAGARRAGLTRPRCARACARIRATRTCRTWTARSSCRTCATWRRCTSLTPHSALPGARSRSAGRAPRMPLPGAVRP